MTRALAPPPTGPTAPAIDHRPRRDWSATARIAAVAIVVLVLLSALTGPALANGGTVRISRAPVGPWFVTVYSSPTPLRTGEVDISTLVQDSADTVLDVPIAVRATAVDTQAEPVHMAATRRQATNKLFKAAKFDIDIPGLWDFRIRVGSVAGAEAGSQGTGAAGEATAREPDGDATEPIAAAGLAASEPGGAVSFQAVVTRRTILDRPVLVAGLVLLPLLVAGWLLLGREERSVERDGDGGRE